MGTLSLKNAEIQQGNACKVSDYLPNPYKCTLASKNLKNTSFQYLATLWISKLPSPMYITQLCIRLKIYGTIISSAKGEELLNLDGL